MYVILYSLLCPDFLAAEQHLMATKAVNVGTIYFQQFYPFAWHNTAVVIVIRYLYSAVSRKKQIVICVS